MGEFERKKGRRQPLCRAYKYQKQLVILLQRRQRHPDAAFGVFSTRFRRVPGVDIEGRGEEVLPEAKKWGDALQFRSVRRLFLLLLLPCSGC